MIYINYMFEIKPLFIHQCKLGLCSFNSVWLWSSCEVQSAEWSLLYLPSPPQALLGVMTTSLQLSVSVLYT